ncbi:hypothetical protein ACQ4LE_002983 [Meloidogyne hapla]
MISPMTFDALLERVQNQDNNTKKEQNQKHQLSPKQTNQNSKINEEEENKKEENNRKRKLSVNSSTNFDFTNKMEEQPVLNSLIFSSTPSFNEENTNIETEDNLEQKLIPNNLFHQTIFDLAQCEALKIKNNEKEENVDDEDFDRQRSHLLEFFEAQKALQKMFSQFVDQQKMFSSSSSSSINSSLPFQQQLVAQLSPFLLSLNNNNNNLQSTSELLLNSFSDSSFQNPFLFPTFQQQKYLNNNNSFFQLNKEEINNSEIFNNNNGPEDLTLSKEEEIKSSNSELINNGQQQNWSYEDQFKQLYDLSEDAARKEWLNDWLQFMHKIGKPVTRIPIMAKQVLDLYELYRLVVQHGGLVEVINKKLWREITKGLNLPPSITSAAFTLRTQYSKYLFDYECHRHNFSNIADLQAAVDGNKREGRKNPLPGTTTKSSSLTPPSIQKQEQNYHQQLSPNSSQMFIIPSTSTLNNNNNCVTTVHQIMVAAAAAASFGTFPSPSQSSFAALFGNLNNNNLQTNILENNIEDNLNEEQQNFQQQLNNVLNVAESTRQVFNKFGLDFIKENDGEQQQYLNITPTIFNSSLPFNDLYIKNDQKFNYSSTSQQIIKTTTEQQNELIKNNERSKTPIIQSNNNFKKQKRSQSVNNINLNEKIINLNISNKEKQKQYLKINAINEDNKIKGRIQINKKEQNSINISLNLNGINYKGILFSCFNNKNNLEISNKGEEEEEWQFLIENKNNEMN